MKNKSRSHCAYWMISSFYASELLHGNIKGYFIGIHIPRNINNLPLFNNNEPRIEDLKPKADVCVLNKGIIESFIFLVEDMPRFISAINALHPQKSLIEDAEIIAYQTYHSLYEQGRTNYIEKNFHDIKEDMILQNVSILYKYNKEDPQNRIEDLYWIKNSMVEYTRILTDNKLNIIGTSHQCFIVGYDIRYKTVVIGFKKSYNNYFTIIPLADNGVHLINSFVYSVYFKPPTRYITPQYFKEKILKYNMLFRNYKTLQTNIKDLTVQELSVKINDEIKDDKL